MRSASVWGVFFIVLGLILLLFSSGIITLNVSDIWKFWPIIFIILGFILIVFRTEEKIEEVKK